MENSKNLLFKIQKVFNNQIRIEVVHNDLELRMFYKSKDNTLTLYNIIPYEEFKVTDYPSTLMEILECFTEKTEDDQGLLYLDIEDSYLSGTRFENYQKVPVPEDFLVKFVSRILKS